MKQGREKLTLNRAIEKFACIKYKRREKQMNTERQHQINIHYALYA